ncbi:MAG: glycosyltransferase [Candidatus Eisenbacteria bacterium]|nr:glycosyltransferase [Candidatus Eisenbacteria bacterium]
MRPWDEGLPLSIDPAAERLRGETIVCFGWSEWESGTETWNQVLLRLARRNRVLFVAPPLERTEVFGGRYAPNGKYGGVRHLRDHLYLFRYPRHLPTFYKPRALVRTIQDLRIRALRGALRRIGGENPILYLLHPKFRGYIGRLDEKLVVYHVLDEYAGYLGANKERLRAEEAILLDRADLVFCVSPSLQNAKAAPHRNVHFVPNGVSFDRFSLAAVRELPAPDELERIRRPRAGYIGRVCDKLDFLLLRDVARLLPDVSFCFAGPVLVVTRESRSLFDEWAALPNVHLLESRRNEEIPAMIGAFDVGLLPYEVSAETRHRYPLKLHEYLAAGKPVVSVPLPCCEEFGDLVRSAPNAGAFAAGIRAALAESPGASRERRLAVARRHDWERIVLGMDLLIRDRIRLAAPRGAARAAG